MNTWIKVSERLPEFNNLFSENEYNKIMTTDEVLVQTANGNMYVAHCRHNHYKKYTGDEYFWYFRNNMESRFQIRNVVAWMELPERIEVE